MLVLICTYLVPLSVKYGMTEIIVLPSSEYV